MKKANAFRQYALESFGFVSGGVAIGAALSDGPMVLIIGASVGMFLSFHWAGAHQ